MCKYTNVKSRTDDLGQEMKGPGVRVLFAFGVFILGEFTLIITVYGYSHICVKLMKAITLQTTHSPSMNRRVFELVRACMSEES